MTSDMEREHDEEKVSYVIPSRTITGSVPELLEEIDDMMEALQEVRAAVLKRAPKPARPPDDDTRRGAVKRVLRKLHLL